MQQYSQEIYMYLNYIYIYIYVCVCVCVFYLKIEFILFCTVMQY